MTFHGRYRGLDHNPRGMMEAMTITAITRRSCEDIHESPLTMLMPLGVLAVGALFAGAVFDHCFVGTGAADFWRGAVAAFTGHRAASTNCRCGWSWRRSC